MRLRPATVAVGLLAVVTVVTAGSSALSAAPAPTSAPASIAISAAPTTTVPTTAVPTTVVPTTTVPTTTVPTTAVPTTVVPTTVVPTTVVPATVACALPSTGFSCAEQQRIAGVQAYLETRPGTVGIVLRDRQTGAAWSNQHAQNTVWTASTIKLAMVVDLFTRAGRGEITLTVTDRAQIQAMLHSSDDDAADALWYRYAGADHLAYNDDFPAYGLTDLTPQRGFSTYFPYWGFQQSTPADLDRLITYVLTELDAADRAYIVDALQHVDADQQWGVWAAGPALSPGNKDGWSLEQGGWVINSVGFAGPGQRYTLAMMDSLGGQGGYDDGVATLSTVAAQLTAGLP